MPPKKKGKKTRIRKAKLEEEERIKSQNLPEVRKRFEYLYSIYDSDDTGSINEEDFPNFVRSLGLYATNAQINKLSNLCKEEENGAYYPSSKLEEVLTPLIIDAMLNPSSDYAAPSEEQLALALKSLDLEHKGHLTESDFRTIMSNNGEKLDSDELEQAFDEAVNPVTGVIDLDRYTGRLLYNSKLF
ncbi:EF hand family protein [Histomonas meleagridis]|uniref:EF hand family protein n=1 Tax=Histomonas meleagridis TaxID=135588 RepID=UPI00355ABA95|nr:EF hand family protein [Histomonas meleagridis]KAH0798368.1 EF hand family protein [Histomonas meleagridis]